MSSFNNSKSLSTQPNTDKENAPISSNMSFERKSSIPNKPRKINEIFPKPHLTLQGQETVNHPTIKLPPHIPTSKGFNKEMELVKKLAVIKSKKTIEAERSSYNSRHGSMLISHKERHSYVNKESRMSAADRSERYSFEASTRTSFIESQKTQPTEPAAKASYGEKEPMKINPVLAPVVREDKHEEEIMPEKMEKEKVTNNENEKKKSANPIETVSFKDQCNKIMEEYAPIIMRCLKKKDEESTPTYCLKRHKIPPNLRAKMIDWMVEVLCSYKCSDQTFFIAVNTMDLYLQKEKIAQEISDLHLLGVTCMFMASKYEEIYPLRLSVVHEKIGHKKLSLEQIKQKEMEVFSTLDYKLTNTTPYEFIMNTLFQLNLKDTMTPKLYDYLLKVCTYLAKANMYDYELISQQDYSELAAATLFVAFKIVEQLDKSFPLTQLLGRIRDILQVEEDIVYDCATRILAVAKNFDKLFPNLENLKKFHPFNFNEISPGRNNDEKSRKNTTH